MKFIELTNAYTGDPVLLNVETINTISPFCTGCRIICGDHQEDVSECYPDLIKELTRLNDRQFFLIESANKTSSKYYGEEEEEEEPKASAPYLEQQIRSVSAEYTGGGINIYYGQTKDGTFFRAVDTDYHYVRFLDTDPSKAGEEADFEYWRKEHTLEEFCDTEETFDWFVLMYLTLGQDYCVDPKSKIAELAEYRDSLEADRNGSRFTIVKETIDHLSDGWSNVREIERLESFSDEYKARKEAYLLNRSNTETGTFYSLSVVPMRDGEPLGEYHIESEDLMKIHYYVG